jgi:hypothetical protein
MNKKGEDQAKGVSKNLVYKVKAPVGGETDKSTSPDQDPKPVENYTEAEIDDDEEEEVIRRKNSEDENSELLRQAAT